MGKKKNNEDRAKEQTQYEEIKGEVSNKYQVNVVPMGKANLVNVTIKLTNIIMTTVDFVPDYHVIKFKKA